MQEEDYAKIKALALSPEKGNLLLALMLSESQLKISTADALKYIIDLKVNAWKFHSSIDFYFGKIQLYYSLSEKLIRYYIGHTEGYEYNFHYNLIVDEILVKEKEFALMESWLIYNEQDDSQEDMLIRLRKRITAHAFTSLSEFLLTDFFNKQ